MPKWKADQSTRLRLTRGKTLKEDKKRRLYEPSFETKVSNFKLFIKNGPFFICAICNCCLYRTSAICFNIEKYSVDKNKTFMVKLYSDNNYICTTCDKALRKNGSYQTVENRLNVIELPKLFQDIRRLKRLFALRRTLF